MSAARTQLMDVFEVSNTVALLPLALYVLALGFGPVVAGPLSESFGRHPVYLGTTPLGAAFTLGAGFTHNFGALCFLRFMAGFCWGPVLATAAGSLSDLFEPKARGPPSAVFILMPFLGPGLGYESSSFQLSNTDIRSPVVGSYVVVQRGWRWTQWTLLFLAAVSFLLTLVTEETNHEIIQRKMKSSGSRTQEKSASSSNQLRHFVTIALLRPLQMLFTEPIVSLTCLYVSAGFGTLFSFFAGVPYSFGLVYGFSLKQSGLVFLSIVIGCLLGLVTILVCDVLLYRKELAKRAPGPMPPEYRLYPAMFGSLGMPLGLFWFAWTTKSGISWASPAASMISFSWGNLCVFVATTQYVSDTFPAQVVASSASANALARYGFAAAFPLFTIKSPPTPLQWFKPMADLFYSVRKPWDRMGNKPPGVCLPCVGADPMVFLQVRPHNQVQKSVRRSLIEKIELLLAKQLQLLPARVDAIGQGMCTVQLGVRNIDCG